MTTVEEAVPASTNILGTRVIAAIIDLVPLVALFVVMALTMGDSDTDTADGGVSLNLNNGPFLLFLALVFAYFFLLEAFAGGTIGKKLMGLRILKDGAPPSIGAIAVRNLVRFVDMLPAFYLLGFIVAAIRGDRRRLGDLAAGTVVVKAA